MRKRKSPEVPASLSRLGQRFATWRRKRVAGQRIPKSRKSAVQVATQHGVSRTAALLKLDYYALKKRVEHASSSDPSSTFIELPPVSLAMMSDCVIEWENAAGARMRVQMKGQIAPDVLALSRSFWDA